VTTRNDQHGAKPHGAGVRQEVVAGSLAEARGRAPAYMYRQGGGPCYGREIERASDLQKGHISRMFDDFVQLGWMTQRRETEAEGCSAGRARSALRRYGTLTEQGVKVLPEFVARYGDLLDDPSTLPPPAGAPGDAPAHELGQMIRRACQRSGLTVRQAARRAGKAQSSLSYLMAGTVRRPDPAEVERLASVLSMPAAEATRAVRLARSLCRGRA
jgi:hypothetical protein